ncbi:MAG: hypothetical protein SGILL_001098 [Bacillariaceae sp.]
MQELLDKLDEMQITPPKVESLALSDISTMTAKEDEALSEILGETKQLFHSIGKAIQDGHLRPSRKHGKDVSRLMECVLYNYSCCASSASSSVSASASKQLSKECQRVLTTLKDSWNLDIQHAHYDYAIAVCNVEKDYKLASRLFAQQIDPNAGHTVVPVQVDNPHGLYAIAKLNSCQLEDDDENALSSAAEHVMDAVQRLVMVSPQDQTVYILAAGNALGYAGRWQDLRGYYQQSFLSQQWGTPLVAAVMQACWLCRRPREAWRVLEQANLLVTHDVSSSLTVSTTPGFGGQWQYGGERDIMDPIVRDVAMKVIADAPIETSSNEDSDEGDGISQSTSLCNIALDLYQQVNEENVSVSSDALLGVVRACEHDKRWQEALSIFSSVLDESKQDFMSGDDPWIVPGNHLFIEELGHHGVVSSSNNRPQIGEMLASVMRSCNESSNFGISLFCLEMLRVAVPVDDQESNSELMDQDVALHQHIGQLLLVMDHSEVLTAAMVALCGLRCYQQAIDLFHSQSKNAFNTPASMVCTYAVTNNARYGTLVLGNPFVSANGHIRRLAKAATRIADNCNDPGSISPERMDQIKQILGRAMNSCTNAHQPILSLHLLRWTNEIVSGNKTDDHMAWYNDFVTAETIIARRWSKDVSGAVDLFENIVEAHGDSLSEWKLTTAAGLGALIASGHGDNALLIFKSLSDSALCTDLFTTIGRHLSKESRWKEVIELYRDATVKGFSSEELGLMTMKAVTSTKIENRLRILRAISDQCASSVGVDPQTWMTSRYWHLKRELGFYYARLLMWWNNPEMAPVDEMNLAIKEFNSELTNELRPKNDVVRVIVEGPNILKETIGFENLNGYERVPKSTEGWIALLAQLVEATKASPIQYDPNFIDSVVKAYKNLGCSRECVQYVSELMDADGIRVRRSTLSEALEAARLEQAFELYRDIQMKLAHRSYTSD